MKNQKRLAALGASALACTLAFAVSNATASGAPGSPDLRVVDAARAGDFVAMKAALRHSNVDTRADDGSTALLWATYAANLDAVRALLAAGANVNAANEFGVTPLLEACRVGGDPGIVAALLKAGAPADAPYRDGETGLMAAAYAGDTAAVRLLLQRHANVNAFEQTHHETALMWAAEQGHLDTVKLLLSSGAQVNVAAQPSSLVDPQIKETFGTRVGYSRGGLTPLMFAVREGHTDIVQTLLDAGADINAQTPDHLTPLMLAIINDRLDMAKMLLDRGAHANDGSLNLVVYLRNLRINSIENSATKPMPWHPNQLTPMQLFTLLLDRGASPTAPVNYKLDSDGLRQDSGQHDSAYVAALKAHDVELVRLLLARGLVNANSIPDVPSTPLVTSLLARDVQGLFRFGSYDYRYPGSHEPLDLAQLLVSHGADVNAADQSGQRPIHVAAEDGNLKLIRFLADHGAQLDAKDRGGLTPVELAMGRRTGPVVERLGARLPVPHPQAVALLKQLLAAAHPDVAVPKHRPAHVAQAGTREHAPPARLADNH